MPRASSRPSTLDSRLALIVLLAACESPECETGEASCSADALELSTCNDGKLEITNCMEQRGQLCENGACVDPWTFGSPVFATCEGWPRTTPESLAEKASYYDEIAVRLHIHPELGFIQ